MNIEYAGQVQGEKRSVRQGLARNQHGAIPPGPLGKPIVQPNPRNWPMLGSLYSNPFFNRLKILYSMTNHAATTILLSLSNVRVPVRFV